MRFLSALILTVFVAHVASAASFAITRVWPAYRTAASFDRISEYFTGEENFGRQTVLRTQPAVREGYYFLVRLDNPQPTLDSIWVEVDVITPASASPRSYRFKTSSPHGTHAFNIGLTGPDWPDAQLSPIAWRVVVRATDGTELAHEQSFLWALPETPAAVK